jgi:hypothetical protein
LATNADSATAKLSTGESWDAKQRGQAVLEYILLLSVIFGIFLVVVRPRMGDIQKKLAEALKSGPVSGDPSKGYPYYFQMR